MAWKIEFAPLAEKEFGKLGTQTQRDIVHYLEKLSRVSDVRQRGKPLRADKAGLWRYRVGKYRLICKIEEDRLVVFVLRVAARDVVYG